MPSTLRRRRLGRDGYAIVFINGKAADQRVAWHGNDDWEYRTFNSNDNDLSLNRVAHLQEFLAPAHFENGALLGTELVECFLDIIADDIDSALRLAMGASHRLLNDGIDNAELLEVLRG